MRLREFYSTWISPQRWFERVGVRAPMQIVIGFMLLALCTFLFATSIGLLPNPDEAKLRERTIISEMTTSYVALGIAHMDRNALHGILETITHRHEEVLSAGLRDKNGVIVTQTAGHETNWASRKETANTPTHIRIPLIQNQASWGELEICFAPLSGSSATWADWWNAPTVRLMVYMLSALFILGWIYLSRMLKILDPAAAIPQRVQLLLDTMVEGAVILDTQDNIVMTNQAFANTAFATIQQLTGRTLSSLSWLAQSSDTPLDHPPWRTTDPVKLQQRGVPVRLKIGARHARNLTVNVSPILAPDGDYQGSLVTFHDHTIVEAQNLQLTELISKFSASRVALHQMRGYADSPPDAQQLEALEKLARAAEEIAQSCTSENYNGYRKSTLNPQAAHKNANPDGLVKG